MKVFVQYYLVIVVEVDVLCMFVNGYGMDFEQVCYFDFVNLQCYIVQVGGIFVLLVVCVSLVDLIDLQLWVEDVGCVLMFV